MIGDYLAIVTLFFGEAFVEFTNNVAPTKLGGPNGIFGLDPIRAFGHQLLTNTGYFYLLLALLVITMGVLHLLDNSRTGRAWRAVREDPLAASLMTIPVNRVKLMAFAFGAAIAAMAGAVFAAQQTSVFPTDFDTPFLILIYAGLILGGAGSVAGAVVGGLVVAVSLEFLRNPTEAGYVFYGVILLTLIVKLRPWTRLVAVLAATAVFGLVMRLIVGAISSDATAGDSQSTGWIHDLLHNWVIVPRHPTTFGNIGFVALIAMVIALVQLRGLWRLFALVWTLYLVRVRVGGAARHRPGDHAPDPHRRDPDRDDERAPAGTARSETGRGGVTWRCSSSRASRCSSAAWPRSRRSTCSVDSGEVLSVIGPNGAGKTTIFNVITGVYRPGGGEVLLDGQSLVGKPLHAITRQGVARTFQSLRLFLNMSVLENVMAATYGGTKAMPWESILRLPRARREEREARASAEQILSFFGQRLAGYRWDQPAYSLSYANRRRLEIARALATEPKLLLLDEPAAGMNPNETHEVSELIGRLRDELSLAILVIEHDMHVVEGVSDRVVALDHGVKIAEGSFDEVASHPAVVEAYLGRDPDALTEAG